MPSFFKRPTTEYSDPVNGERWKAEDTARVTEHFHAQSAKLNEQIKDAKGRGVPTGIGYEAGRMIPAPPSYDPFNGKGCQAIGLVKAGFGVPRVCGRQATAVLEVAHFEADVPKSPSAELTEAALAYMAYGASAGPNPIPAASGPRKGKLIADPGMIGPNSRLVCPFHSQALFQKALHPDDNNGIVPQAPKLTGDLVFGLDELTPGRPFRAVAQDASFAWVTDGLSTVMCHKRDYVALLAEYGLLPDDTTQPLP